MTCDSEIYARLHKVENDGSLNPNPIASSLVVNNAFSFKNEKLPLDINSQNVVYQIAISGCDETLYRPVTGVNNKQDVSYASTMVGMSSQSTLNKPLSQADKGQIEGFIKQLHGSTMVQVYTNLNSSPNLSAQFQDIFQDTPVKLVESHPTVTLMTFATMINEGLSSTFKISAIHFDPTYDIAQEWIVDGVSVSISNQWVFSPGADKAGTYVVTSIVGRNDGTGKVDRSKSFFTHSQPVVVLNTLPAVAPDFTLVANVSKTGVFSALVQTGTALENCGSFASFLFTDSSTKPLPSNAGFNRTCSVFLEQTESVTLSGADGMRTLYLWSKDSNGLVSDFPKSATVYLDSTPPIASINSPAGVLRGGNVLNVTFSAADALVGLHEMKLQYAADGATFSDVATLALTDTSYSWTVPTSNTATAKLRLKATDKALNVINADSNAFTIDSTAPAAPTIILASSNPTNSINATVTVSSCADRAMIYTSSSSTAPAPDALGWQSCTTSAGAITATLVVGDGSKTIYAWARDVAGNVSTSTNVTTTLDQTIPGAPTIVFSSNSTVNEKKKLATTSLTNSSCTDRAKILISTSTSTPLVTDAGWQNCVTGAGGVSFTLSPALEGTYPLKAWAKDNAGNISPPTNLSFLYDISAPVMSSMNINGGITTTGNNNLLVTLQATSSRTDITAFCLKYNEPTAPLGVDNCWTTLASIGYPITNNLSLTDFPFQIGTILGAYDIRVWVKDELDNISAVTDTLNSDFYTMNYQPDPPPTVSNAIASSTDTPSNPLVSADTTITIGSDVFIRWKITDNNPIPAGNVSLYYTTNETTYTLIASGLNNSGNGGCTVDASSSGCFKWPAASPLSSYYKIKVSVTDSGISSVFSMTNPLNTSNTNFLSGNTSLGLGGSANSAILLGEGESSFNDSHDNGAIAVTKTGHIFYKYKNVGLVYVSPEDGLLKTLIPTTGTTTGNGGNASAATLRALTRVTLDYEGNVLLWDFNQIRKITLSVNPWKIDIIAGGGVDNSDGATALSASIGTVNNQSLFTTFPNGRIYYQKGKEIWYFDPTDGKVKKHLSLGGLGTSDMAGVYANYDNDTCPMSFMALTFDKLTSSITKIIRKAAQNTSPSCGNLAAGAVTAGTNTNFDLSSGLAQTPHPPIMDWSTTPFTGLDGKMYILSQGRGFLKQYNPANNTYQPVLGNGGIGRCIDGTPALSCPAIIMSAFVNEYGKIYFVDMGVIRTIDQSGNVQTMAGQPRNYGIGSNPISARYSRIPFIDVAGNDVYVNNKLENQIVKFSLTGGLLNHVAGKGISSSPGNGADAKLAGLSNCGWSTPCGFKVDATANRLYHHTGSGQISYINLATGKWVIEPGIFQDSTARISYLGQNSDGVIAWTSSHGGVTTNTNLRVLNPTTFANTLIYGTNTQLASPMTSLCVGTTGTSCTLAGSLEDSVQTQYKYDTTLARWLLVYKGQNQVNSIPSLGGTVNAFETTLQPIEAFDFRRDGTDQYLYYCATNGNLYKRNVVTDVETNLALPSTSIKCAGAAVHYHSGRNSLIFIYTQNGLYGVAEFKNP